MSYQVDEKSELDQLLHNINKERSLYPLINPQCRHLITIRHATYVVPHLKF